MHGVEVQGVDCPAIDGILQEASVACSGRCRLLASRHIALPHELDRYRGKADIANVASRRLVYGYKSLSVEANEAIGTAIALRSTRSTFYFL